MIMVFAAQFNCIIRCDASSRASECDIAIFIAHPIRCGFVLSFRRIHKSVVH